MSVHIYIFWKRFYLELQNYLTASLVYVDLDIDAGKSAITGGRFQFPAPPYKADLEITILSSNEKKRLLLYSNSDVNCKTRS